VETQHSVVSHHRHSDVARPVLARIVAHPRGKASANPLLPGYALTGRAGGSLWQQLRAISGFSATPAGNKRNEAPARLNDCCAASPAEIPPSKGVHRSILAC
jgi:hypothetical protein